MLPAAGPGLPNCSDNLGFLALDYFPRWWNSHCLKTGAINLLWLVLNQDYNQSSYAKLQSLFNF
jgi:hypothetical protein